MFGDIGFDHPGRFGLDFDDAIRLIAIYCAAILCGIVFAGLRKRWISALMQLAIPSLIGLISFLLHSGGPTIRAADHLDLMGKTKAEVHAELGLNSRRTSGKAGDFDCETFGEAKIIYDKDGRVWWISDHYPSSADWPSE